MERNRVFGNRYRIVERAGIGGMAEVYKATDEVLGRTVAIKVMLPQYASDHTFAARFRQEAQAAANLSSPYIVSIYDWGQDGDTYYIAMEYVRGVDLKTAIQERGSINPRKVAEIGSQVCAALSVAHARDIIHRDIKPQNIMIQPDGNAKVMDFGIARAGNTNLTTTNSVLGTAHYVSPEQAQGKPLKPSSDLYSLGVTMYEAATGKLPFEGPDAVSVAMKQVSEQPVPPRQINPNIDPDLEAIIMHAMEKDPEKRFASATEMRNALRSYLAGAPLPSWGQSYGAAPTSVLPGSNSSDPTRVMGGTASQSPATSVLPATGSPTSTFQSGGTQMIDPVTEKKKSRKKGAIIAVVVVAAIVAALLGWGASGIAGGGPFRSLFQAAESGNVSVPNVVGMTQDQAQTALTQQGLTLGTVTARESSTVDAGKVISQDPSAGVSLSRGTKVNIVISTGMGQVQVPDLSGMSAAEAERALSAAGLKGSNGGTVASDSVSENQVASQDPAAGVLAAKGATVTYMISSGPSTVTVNASDYLGSTASSASSKLSGLGFSVVTTHENSNKYPEGTVCDISPTGSVSKGATITLTISEGAASASSSGITIPSVTGQSQSDATSTLEGLGLSVSVEHQSSSSVSSGNVIGTSPGYGTTVQRGSTVTLVVSSGSGSGGDSKSGGDDSNN